VLHEKPNVADKLHTLPEATGREKATTPVFTSNHTIKTVYT